MPETPQDNDETVRGFLRGFRDFLRETRVWWLTPLVLGILVIALLVLTTESAVSPFIYSLF